MMDVFVVAVEDNFEDISLQLQERLALQQSQA